MAKAGADRLDVDEIGRALVVLSWATIAIESLSNPRDQRLAATPLSQARRGNALPLRFKPWAQNAGRQESAGRNRSCPEGPISFDLQRTGREFTFPATQGMNDQMDDG
jgi:hypothetical protein